MKIFFLDTTNIQNTESRVERLLYDYIDFTHLICLHSLFKSFPHFSSIDVKVKVKVKVKQYRYRLGVAQRVQEGEVPRFHDNGTGWW